MSSPTFRPTPAGSGTGDMTKAVYDTDDDGTVDDSTLWDGQALPSIDDATGGQVLALKSDKSALEFATVASGGGGITWNEVTGTTQSAVADNGYIANNEALVTVTLPSTCAVGKVVHVAGKGAGGWKIAQNAGQSIVYGNVSSTTGTGGSVSSTHARDCIGLLCTVADSEFMVFSWVGTVEVV